MTNKPPSRGGKPLKVTGRACASCPYLREHPSGVWSREEYEKLRKYDTGTLVSCPRPDGSAGDVVMPELAVFWCHQTNRTGKPTACRGWLSTHRHHAAVNLAMAFGAIREEDIPTSDESATYFASGTEAAENGLKDIKRPKRAARVMAQKLTASGAGAWEDSRQVPGDGRLLRADPNADPGGCDRGCGRRFVYACPVFGEPGGPGVSANVCAQCAREGRPPTWCDPNAKLDNLIFHGHAKGVLKKLTRIHALVTLRDLAFLTRDFVRAHRGAGPQAMEQFDKLLALAGLTWGMTDLAHAEGL